MGEGGKGGGGGGGGEGVDTHLTCPASLFCPVFFTADSRYRLIS